MRICALLITTAIHLSTYAEQASFNALGQQAQKTANSIRTVLVPGVDQCFNPGRPRENAQAKGELLRLAAQLDTIALSAQGGANVAPLVGQLQMEMAGFDTHLSVFCGTKRQCMEMGFEGNPKYPRCLPVNGDSHRNVQYLTLQSVLDRDLPQIVQLFEAANR